MACNFAGFAPGTASLPEEPAPSSAPVQPSSPAALTALPDTPGSVQAQPGATEAVLTDTPNISQAQPEATEPVLTDTPNIIQTQPETPPASASPTAPADQAPLEASPTLSSIALPVIMAYPSVWIDPNLPAAYRDSLAGYGGVPIASQAEQATLRLEAGSQAPVSHWIYALAAPFPVHLQGVSSSDLQRLWRGERVEVFAGKPLFMDESTQAMLSVIWGAPAPGAVSLHPASELSGVAWAQQPAWAILPFEALEPRWKVLEVDGVSPLRKEFNPLGYPLTVPVSLSGDPARVAMLSPLIPPTNRDPGKLTTLAMTGVTALVRATAFTMEQKGVLYPGRDIGDWLRNADLTHISNEVPFARNCPFPNPVQPDMSFCSSPDYISLLEDMGTDIVELTGDHFQDWGAAAMLYTLDLYRERGWPYYGGGANLEEGRRALTVEHNGNRLAFIGCNAKGGGYAQAGADRPGAVVCDRDWMHQEIARLRDEGYLVVATFQHFEYYTYKAQANQIKDSRGMADAGAAIVSGSQAHQPQGMEFYSGAFIHYGLGNLFFDQYDVSLATRQAFIDRHVFYDGRYIGVELLPIMFVDYARPRPMTPDEREELLDAVFTASGW